MSRYAQITALLCVFLLSSAAGRAESYTHNFNSLWDAEPRALAFASSNTIGTVSSAPEMAYTVSGTGSSFAYQEEKYVIYLKTNSAFVTTSVAVEDLTYIDVHCLASPENVKVWYSTTSNAGPWTPITDSEAYSCSGTKATVYMPAKGNYFLKIGCTSAVSIFEISYYVSPCHCLRVVSE